MNLLKEVTKGEKKSQKTLTTVKKWQTCENFFFKS